MPKLFNFKEILRIKLFYFISVFLFSFFPSSILGAEIKIVPEIPIQGEPIKITVSGQTIDDVAKIKFDGKSLYFSVVDGEVTALYGFDLKKESKVYNIDVVFENGRSLSKQIEVKARKKIEETFGIPEKLGGNTTESQTKLVSTLADENSILNNIVSAKKKYWVSGFGLPLAKNIITDNYGYSRKTGQYDISHKGVDFRANIGTPVYAIGAGQIKMIKEFRNYGKTVVVDHGLNILSFYMHLSRVNVKEGAIVKKGTKLGEAGDTGYAESPHLHLTIRINGVSIDPIKFVEILSK